MPDHTHTHLADSANSDILSGGSGKKSRHLVLISMTTYMYLELIMDDLEKTGYAPLEFLSKCELFLKCITPKYPKNSFDDIIKIIVNNDPNAKGSNFYKGIISLRALCTGEGNEQVKVMDAAQKFSEVSSSEFSDETIFFTTFLVEKLQKELRSMRTNSRYKNLSINELREIISEKFDECVLNTLMKSSGIS